LKGDISMKHIFVSYAREDKKFARQLTSRLRESGRIPWQDLRNIRGGDLWQTTIDDALRNAEALIVVMSPQATKSQYVTYEWAFALGAGVRVIPVIKRPTKQLHPRLSNIQYIDFTTRRGTPWVNLRRALPARPSTIQTGPEIRAKFNVVGGKPQKDGAYYVINAYLHKAPRAAEQVTYEFHDETLKKVKWSTKAAAAKFELTFRSNGDSLLTASIRRPGKPPLRIASPLYDALRRGHSSNAGPRIKRALREIRDSRTL
jgi:TIR domain